MSRDPDIVELMRSPPRPNAPPVIKNLDLSSTATASNDGAGVSRETLERLKRTLHNAIDRLDQVIASLPKV